MVLERKAMRRLLDWKRSRSGRSLIISGARQVGKTYLARLFAREQYASFIKLNFLRQI